MEENNKEYSLGSEHRSIDIELIIDFLIEKQKEGYTHISTEINYGYYKTILDIKLIAEKNYNN
jgi:hypothetical protein